jgi:hypothetical protein
VDRMVVVKTKSDASRAALGPARDFRGRLVPEVLQRLHTGTIAAHIAAWADASPSLLKIQHRKLAPCVYCDYSPTGEEILLDSLLPAVKKLSLQNDLHSIEIVIL